MKDKINVVCDNVELKGTIILAEEDINVTISGERNAIDKMLDFLRSDDRLKGLTLKESSSEYQPFSKMKVRLKREIVNVGVSNLGTSVRGQYVDPEHWNDFVSQSDVLVIDTRNEYEVKLVKFKNAINPHPQRFRDFPQRAESFFKSKDLKVATYCTGGIRCEKSTAYMKSVRFKDVYLLKGGILCFLKKLVIKVVIGKASVLF